MTDQDYRGAQVPPAGPAAAYPSYQQPYLGQQQYPPHSPSDYRTVEAEKAAKSATAFGIIGIFIAGIIFGPLAIAKAKFAEENGVPATTGKVLGWISTIFAVIVILFYIMWGTSLA